MVIWSGPILIECECIRKTDELGQCETFQTSVEVSNEDNENLLSFNTQVYLKR